MQAGLAPDRLNVYIASRTAISAVGWTMRNVLLAQEGDAAVAACSCRDGQVARVGEELSRVVRQGWVHMVAVIDVGCCSFILMGVLRSSRCALTSGKRPP